MKKLIFSLALVLALSSTSFADVWIGTDLADATSGSVLELTEGEVKTLEIWLSGDVDQTIRGISFDLTADAPGVVNSSNLLIDDAATRWVFNNSGDGLTDLSATGLLINDLGLATLGGAAGTGVTFTNGDPVRLGTIDFSADMLGNTDVVFTEGSNGVTDQNGVVDGFVNGGRSISVINAIPEPGAVAFFGMMTAVGFLRRRR